MYTFEYVTSRIDLVLSLTTTKAPREGLLYLCPPTYEGSSSLLTASTSGLGCIFLDSLEILK